MKNPIKFIQEVKQEAFKVTWPTGKETLQGTLMVVAMAIIASLFSVSLLPESPRWYMEQGNKEDAERVLKDERLQKLEAQGLKDYDLLNFIFLRPFLLQSSLTLNLFPRFLILLTCNV